MSDQYLILSDLHLCDVEEHSDGWRYFKNKRYQFDQPFADLVKAFAKQGDESDQHILVLNGDIFDFDLVTEVPSDPDWQVKRLERRCGLAPTATRSVWKLSRILDHHPIFVDILADFLSGGGRVVYVLGNHDREMHFEPMRSALVTAIKERALQRGLTWNLKGLDFKPCFFHVPGVLFADHGHQYDPFSAFWSLVSPVIVVNGEERLELPMGNLSNRYLLSKMGSFNPFSGDYICSGLKYAGHWLRHYAFSRRSLVYNWFIGSLLVLFTLLRNRRHHRRKGEGDGERERELMEPQGLSQDQLRSLVELQSAPVSRRTFRMMREFWLDRALLALLMLGIAVAIALTTLPLWLKIAIPLVAFPLAYRWYERLVDKDSIFDIRERAPECATAIAQLLDVPLVTFGHDHFPRIEALPQGATFVDTGTWAPITEGGSGSKLSPGYRNYLIVVADDEGGVDVSLRSWSEFEEEHRSLKMLVGDPARSCA